MTDLSDQLVIFACCNLFVLAIHVHTTLKLMSRVSKIESDQEARVRAATQARDEAITLLNREIDALATSLAKSEARCEGLALGLEPTRETINDNGPKGGAR